MGRYYGKAGLDALGNSKAILIGNPDVEADVFPPCAGKDIAKNLSVFSREESHMHMAMVIGGGLVLLGLFMLFGKLWGGTASDVGFAAKLFVPVWLVVSLVNMWVGVTKAGYSLREELPILFIVFALPAIVAAVAIWRLAR